MILGGTRNFKNNKLNKILANNFLNLIVSVFINATESLDLIITKLHQILNKALAFINIVELEIRISENRQFGTFWRSITSFSDFSEIKLGGIVYNSNLQI